MNHPRLLIAAVVAAVLLSALAAQAAGDRLPARKLTPNEAARLPGGAQALERETVRQRVSGERRRQVHDLVGAQHVSAKSQRLAKSRDDSGTDTLRVLLVRIAFATDRSGPLTSVTEDGNFQLGEPPADDPLPIDPPPHNRAYFEAHMRGLSEYYRYQSGGRLHIESRVLPDGDTDVYQLGDIADYGPGAGSFWTIESLERLVLDMIAAADEGTQADGSVDLSDFADDDSSTYIIFTHAGGDWQSDVNKDSPNDIPTFFMTLGEAVPLISGGTLSECSIIPETTNQDGYKGSIAAALYHEFGHALGLADVYDATTGLTSVGIWDLMDSGTNLAANLGVDTNGDGQADLAVPVTGILPPSLGAWNKWYLGWAEVDTLGGETRTVKLPAAGVPRGQYSLYASSGDFDPGYPQLLVAGASSREFFLIENRWVPLLESDTPFDPYNPSDNTGGLYFRSDPATGVVLYLAGQVNGVEVNTGLYDYFMPEGGLLVWHVNLDRIEANLATNSINRYGDGLKLVEADGIQDIGVLGSYVTGWYGSARDPFTPYNSAGSLVLEPEGRPNSRAYDRSLTGVHLWDIADDGDARGAVMRFEARVEPLAGQFPFMLDDRDDGPRALAPWSVTPLNGDLLLLADAPPAGQPATLFALTPLGEPAFAPVPGRPQAWAWELTDELAGPLADCGGNALAGTRNGRVTSLRPAAGGIEEAWHAELGDTLVAGPLPLDLAAGLRVVCATGPGELVLLDGLDGAPVGDPLTLVGPGPAPAPAITAAPRVWVRGDDATVACFGPLGWYEVLVTADGFGGAAEFHPYTSQEAQTVVRPALVPAADEARLVILGLGAWRLTGSGVAEVAAWSGRLEEPLASDPAVADLDGDGRNDIVATTSRTIHAWQADGTVLMGFPVGLSDLFPLPDSTRIAGEIVVTDGTGDGLNEVFVTTHTGRLLGIGATGRLLEGTPFLCADGSASSLAAGQGTLYVASAGGYAGPPHDRHRTNGRLVGYRLAAAGAQGTSEWLGPLGGPLRAGPEGEPAALGPLSPLAGLSDDIVIYPNPVRGGEATVRFPGGAGSDARLTLFTLEGEEVLRLSFVAGAGPISEHTFPLDVASGVYLCRFEWEGSQGPTRTVTPLAVER
jgi:M6 family metalloprotease-like protein